MHSSPGEEEVPYLVREALPVVKLHEPQPDFFVAGAGHPRGKAPAREAEDTLGQRQGEAQTALGSGTPEQLELDALGLGIGVGDRRSHGGILGRSMEYPRGN